MSSLCRATTKRDIQVVLSSSITYTKKDFATRQNRSVTGCIREVELEVELPRRRARRIVPILVHEREAELDDLQEVDVTPQQLVLVVHCAAKLSDWPDNHSREFCVLMKNKDINRKLNHPSIFLHCYSSSVCDCHHSTT